MAYTFLKGKLSSYRARYYYNYHSARYLRTLTSSINKDLRNINYILQHAGGESGIQGEGRNMLKDWYKKREQRAIRFLRCL